MPPYWQGFLIGVGGSFIGYFIAELFKEMAK